MSAMHFTPAKMTKFLLKYDSTTSLKIHNASSPTDLEHISTKQKPTELPTDRASARRAAAPSRSPRRTAARWARPWGQSTARGTGAPAPPRLWVAGRRPAAASSPAGQSLEDRSGQVSRITLSNQQRKLFLSKIQQNTLKEVKHRHR